MQRKSLFAGRQKRAHFRTFLRPMNFESLETRRVLTCTITPAVGYSTAADVEINCNNGSDNVKVTSTDQGTIQIKVGNNAAWIVNKEESLETLTFNLGGGSNRLNIDFSHEDDEDTDTGPAGLLNFPEIHVTGGSGAERINVDFGEESTDGIDDNGRGALTLTFDLGAGNDVLTVHSFDDVNGLTFFAFMGDGADKVTLDFENDLDEYEDLYVDLGTGNDKFLMDVAGDVNGDWFGPNPFTCCQDEESEAATFIGGTGNDLFGISIHGNLTGQACTSVDLGSGNDLFGMVVGDGDGGGEQSTGDFALDVQGGTGNDSAFLTFERQFQGTLCLTGNLGAGNDQYSADFGNGCGDVVVGLVTEAGNDSVLLSFVDVTGNLDIAVSTGANGDNVQIFVFGDLNGDANVIDVDLGTGNNMYTLTLEGDINGDFLTTVNGGSGKDLVTMSIGSDANGEFDAAVMLEGGNDTFSLTVAGEVDFNLFLDMCEGSDNAWIELDGDINGDFNMEVRMGVGNDNLTVHIEGNISQDLFDSDLINIYLDGDDEGNETDDGIDCLWLEFGTNADGVIQELLVDLELVNWECVYINGDLSNDLLPVEAEEAD